MGHCKNVCAGRFFWTRAAALSAALVGVVAALAMFAPYPAFAASPQVAVHTQEEIRARVAASGATADQQVVYDEAPDLVAPYEDAGVTSHDETLVPALAVLNNMRYIAGLDDNVTLDQGMIDQAQAAAYVNLLNRSISHYPAKPEGISDSIYQLGFSGARSSNIAMGYRNLNGTIIDGWMSDADSGNVNRVGHRRWVLNPKMGKTGFGAANRSYAMYAFDRSADGGQSSVAWPAQQMPLDYFADGDPWSLSVGQRVDAANVGVHLVRRGDGKSWDFRYGEDDDPTQAKYFNVENSLFGQPGCIIFRPDGVSYAPGDVFDVEVSGVGDDKIAYSVEFFELTPVTGVELSAGALTLSKGEYESLTATVTPPNATRQPVSWASSDENVATVNSRGEVRAVGPGTCVVTATVKGHSAQATVTVAQPVTDLTLSGPASNLEVGETSQLKAVVSPSDATDKAVTWASSDEDVAKVDQTGLVSAVGPGTALIYARAGDCEASLFLEVNAAEDAAEDAGGANAGVDTTRRTPARGPLVLNARTVNAQVVRRAAEKAGISLGRVTSITVGKKVKKIRASAFRGCGARTLVVNSGYLTKKLVRNALKGSKISKVKVPASKRAAYKKIFTKKVCGKKVRIA